MDGIAGTPEIRGRRRRGLERRKMRECTAFAVSQGGILCRKWFHGLTGADDEVAGGLRTAATAWLTMDWSETPGKVVIVSDSPERRR